MALMRPDEVILEEAAIKASQILRIPHQHLNKTKFLYLYTLLYNLMGQGPCEEGDENMRHFLNTHNKHLGFAPASRLTDEASLDKIIRYLESFNK